MIDDKNIIKPGDFFNKTHRKNGNDIWDNCNRFQTCKLIAIQKDGCWVYQEYWWQHSKNEYPFLSCYIYWNPNSQTGKTICIKKISDPEREGFKHLKTYLK